MLSARCHAVDDVEHEKKVKWLPTEVTEGDPFERLADRQPSDVDQREGQIDQYVDEQLERMEQHMSLVQANIHKLA